MGANVWSPVHSSDPLVSSNPHNFTVGPVGRPKCVTDFFGNTIWTNPSLRKYGQYTSPDGALLIVRTDGKMGKTKKRINLLRPRYAVRTAHGARFEAALIPTRILWVELFIFSILCLLIIQKIAVALLLHISNPHLRFAWKPLAATAVVRELPLLCGYSARLSTCERLLGAQRLQSSQICMQKWSRRVCAGTWQIRFNSSSQDS